VSGTLAERLFERLRPWYLRRIYFKWVPESKPEYFSSCWDFPEFSPPLLEKTKDIAVIFLPMNDWHTRIQRSQQLAREMARRGFPVIYVNPHLGREFPDLYRRGQNYRLLQIEPNLLELHIHLPREPVFHHRRLAPDESSRVAAAVRRALAEVDVKRSVQIAAFPIWLDAALAIRRDLPLGSFLYDCHDYLPGFSNIAPEIVVQETELLRSSDLVLCTSDALMARAASVTAAPRVLLRNAAADDFFRVTPQPSTQILIGYAGALDSWFDVEAVRFAAESRPDWRFELIGRVENDAVLALSALPNVQLTGEVPFSELPQRLARFTVAVIPFLINPLIEATDPIKAYEYLACGLPVVASAMPELERFGEWIACYESPADFVAKLNRAAGPEPDDVLARRRRFVETETWNARGAKLAEIIEQLNVS